MQSKIFNTSVNEEIELFFPFQRTVVLFSENKVVLRLNFVSHLIQIPKHGMYLFSEDDYFIPYDEYDECWSQVDYRRGLVNIRNVVETFKDNSTEKYLERIHQRVFSLWEIRGINQTVNEYMKFLFRFYGIFWEWTMTIDLYHRSKTYLKPIMKIKKEERKGDYKTKFKPTQTRRHYPSGFQKQSRE